MAYTYSFMIYLTITSYLVFGNLPDGYVAGDSFPMQHPIVMSLIWCAVLLAIFIPLGISRYRRAGSR